MPPTVGDQVARLRLDRCEEIDNPNANAFWRVAPAVRLRDLAILTTGVFWRSIVFSSRTSVAVHSRRFVGLLANVMSFQQKFGDALYIDVCSTSIGSNNNNMINNNKEMRNSPSLPELAQI
jgi:hypothetical protein